MAAAANCVGQAILCRQDPGSLGEGGAARAKGTFSDFNPEARQAVARREQFLLACVLHQEDGPGAHHCCLPDWAVR